MAESPQPVPSEDGNSFLEDELEALRSIYINETNVYEDKEATVISIDLHPATADNLQEQYVKLTLKLTVKDGYPDVIPEIDIRNPRGLSDEKISSITKDLLKIAEDKRGNSMLFEIIEAAKDYLTAGNRPCEECAICLYGFHEDDIFTRTECYHYFHSSCLARYARNSTITDDEASSSDDSSNNELLCPVCRLPISFDGLDDSYPSPVKGDDEFSMTDTILETQKKLQELYIKQVEKGGIIDLEAEKNKYLIEISHVPSVLDTAPEVSLEEEISSTMPQVKDNAQTASSPEKAKNDRQDSQKYPSNRSSNSERPDRKFTKHHEERRGNAGSRPYHGNDNRSERYQSNRGGGDGYRRGSRGSRNNYDRRYDGYSNEGSDRYGGGINKNRFSNPRRNNWHENPHTSDRYERRDRYDDRYSPRYERNDRYNDKSSLKHKRHDKDESVHGYDGERKKQQDSEVGASCRDDEENDETHEIDQRSGNDDTVQDGQIDKVGDEKQGSRYGSDRRNVSYRGNNRRNNQYDDRRENRYDRSNARYDNNRRYGRFDDNRGGQYNRRNGRFDNRKFNEHNGSRRNENFASGRSHRENEVNQNRYLHRENEDKELEYAKENEADAKNEMETKRENSGIPHENVEETSRVENEYGTEPVMSSKTLSKDEVVSKDVENASAYDGQNRARSSGYSSDRKHNFPNRNAGSHNRQNDNRNYNRNYQRTNSNGDRHNGYSKKSNYQSERRQPKPQNFRKKSNDLDEGENIDLLKTDEGVACGTVESVETNLEDNQVYNDEESGDFSDSQHSRKTPVRTESGNTNHYRKYQDGKQGYSNRYQNNNKNYRETRPYRSNPRSRNNQNDYSERTPYVSKRFVPPKHASDSSHNIPQTENDLDAKQNTISKENDESAPAETSSNKLTQVPPKSSDLEKSVPTSNFLPPMSSVAPPPGFQNPTRKIVYGLAAANPPPGFNRS